MKLLNSTIDTIMQIAGKSHEPSFFIAFMYFYIHGQDDRTLPEVRKYIGVSEKQLNKARSLLKEYGFLKETKLTKNKKQWKVVDTPPSFNQFSFDAVYYSLIDSNSTYKSNRKREYPDETKLNSDDFSLEDVLGDSDWQAMKPVLEKYFQDHQIDPIRLVSKKQFYKKLVLLWDDLGPEKFDTYCEWYRVNKYPRVKFNYGMFLYPGVIGDWKDDTDSEDDRYMSTGSAKQKEKFKKAAESSIAELERIMSEDNDG